jgi:hypothetical protein
MILPVRISLGFGLCLFSLHAGIMAGAGCFPTGYSALSADSCDFSLPGTPSPGSGHASFSYQAPATSGFSISASAVTGASVLTTQGVSLRLSSYVGMGFTYDTPGPFRPGLAFLEFHADGDLSRHPNGGGELILSPYTAGWFGGRCLGCFPAGYVPFDLGSPFLLSVSAFADALSFGPGSVSSSGSASVSFQLFEQNALGQPGAAVEAFQFA